jgi:riboflavin kinase/FMN adenylyltransferase
MELIRGLHNLTPAHRGCVATIGNFDGLHLGHQAVLGQLAERGRELGLPTVVISFEPLPREYFMGTSAPPRLSRLREKLQALRRYSVDRVLCLRFNAALAEMPAAEFVRRILVDGLDVRYLVVGDDFRFGHRRTGDFALLQAAGREHGFRVAHMYTHELDGARVSSTRIRAALQEGDLGTAQRLLGRPYRMSGRVVHGDARGRTIGYPTANLRIGRHEAPVRGVFAVEVFGLDPEPLRGVANLGTRPTVGGRETRLEIHLFDFDQDIYGRHLQVDLLRRIREERRFESLDDLVAQIDRDAEEARAYFAADDGPAH